MRGVDGNKKVPAIRFEGFSGEWVEDKILNISPLQRGFDLPKNKMKVGNYPVVMSNGINGYHSEYKAIGPGVVTGRSGTIGNIHFIQPNYWPHNTSLWVTSFKGNEPLYIYYMYLKLDLNRFGTGSGVPTLNRNDVHEQLIKIPKDKKEQTKIGNYFQQLDTLIAQHQQKHDKLQNLKKALLEKCFPKQGEHTPELRFKGFSGAWEEKALGDVSKIKTGSSNREDSGLDGKYTFFDRSEDIRTSNIFLFDCEAIIVAGEGSDFIPKYFVGKFDLHQRTYAVMDFIDCDGKYLFYYIHLFRKHFLNYAVGSTVKSLRLPMFEEMPIQVPKKEEQTKIGNLFQQLDTLINQQQTQLSKLKNIKQACLEKMFV